jgi:hypothetical protein
LPLKSQYKLSSLLFVTNNKSQFTTNLDNDSIHTRHNNDLHLPQANLAIHQKGVFYSCIKIFNNLPFDIKILPAILRHLKEF